MLSTLDASFVQVSEDLEDLVGCRSRKAKRVQSGAEVRRWAQD